MENELFSVVVLAGGLATRLGSQSEVMPKSLMTIHNMPFVDYQLKLLYQQGIREVIFCVGHLGEMIENHVGNGQKYGMSIKFFYDGEPLKGTAGAIKHILPWLPENFFVIYGDCYLPCDANAIQQAFIAGKQPALMTVVNSENLYHESNIVLENDQIIKYDKFNPTSKMKFIDYGFEVFNQSAFDYMPQETIFDLSHLFEILHARTKLAAFTVETPFYEVGSFEGIKRFSAFSMSKQPENNK